MSTAGAVLIRALWKPLKNEHFQVLQCTVTRSHTISAPPAQVTIAILVILGILHAGLGVGFKVLHPSISALQLHTTSLHTFLSVVFLLQFWSSSTIHCLLLY